MSDKLSHPDPAKVMVIRDVVPKVITTLSVPFWRFGKIKIGGRGTIGTDPLQHIRYISPNNSRSAPAIWFPRRLLPSRPDRRSQAQSRGDGRSPLHLRARRRGTTPPKETLLSTLPSLTPHPQHHLFLGPWHSAYPNAQVLGPEGLPESRAKANKEAVPFSVVFQKAAPTTTISPEFDAEFDWEYVWAHANKEIVFHHKPTRTLIEADYFFNAPSTEQFSKTEVTAESGVLTKIFNALTHTRGAALGQQRMIWWGTSAGDRGAFAKSTARINKWDFERIIPCHGDVIESGGKTVFQKLFKWHLDLARQQASKDP
jgi:hypothetical protein